MHSANYDSIEKTQIISIPLDTDEPFTFHPYGRGTETMLPRYITIKRVVRKGTTLLSVLLEGRPIHNGKEVYGDAITAISLPHIETNGCGTDYHDLPEWIQDVITDQLVKSSTLATV